eukprot:12527980-Ditylum_brightwellii.AAC.1
MMTMLMLLLLPPLLSIFDSYPEEQIYVSVKIVTPSNPAFQQLAAYFPHYQVLVVAIRAIDAASA